ncbi:MAG: D-glycero-beta-D-manno-heptose 1-phosphate adenylyltransferase [candidate division KSB1 bacterium]|nr:D-glycero-beta-D-manno-heptose 1-phosphate adenylyltransferase [candidate division KSB1 bacterium]
MTHISKQKTLAELMEIVALGRSTGKKVVWTNGCFDILHAGHVLYLHAAKEQGDILIVGVNSDASVRRNKGPQRPINSEKDRLIVLAALECVDYLLLFDDDSPVQLIDQLRPDIYVKGGDYTIDTVNQDERRLVERYGGKIVLIPGVPGLSTSAVIEKILQAYR